MMKPKKRLSGGMGLSADGIDPLFEFDVPRIFMDLTLPLRFAKATSEGLVAAHDPWFDLVHENHSRPTEEFLAAQQQAQTQTQPQSESATSHRTFHHHHHHHGASHLDADGEKENAGGGGSASGTGGATRRKRRNVAYSTKTDTAPVGTLKATMRTVSASSSSAKTVSATNGPPVKKPTKLPFGNSTGSSSATATPASKQITTGTGVNTMPRKRPVAERSTAASKARSRTLPLPGTGQRKNPVNGAADKDLQDLQALLAKHNKKFKTNHTYEPRQHSVRDVRMWEKHTQKSYYKLTLEDRFHANAEIAQLVQEREDAATG